MLSHFMSCLFRFWVFSATDSLSNRAAAGGVSV